MKRIFINNYLFSHLKEKQKIAISLNHDEFIYHLFNEILVINSATKEKVKIKLTASNFIRKQDYSIKLDSDYSGGHFTKTRNSLKYIDYHYFQNYMLKRRRKFILLADVKIVR